MNEHNHRLSVSQCLTAHIYSLYLKNQTIILLDLVVERGINYFCCNNSCVSVVG